SHAAMGQEAGKHAWLKPTGGYHTITGRRYGRRHACASFRQSLNSQDENQHQHNGEYEGLELDDDQEQNSLCMYISVSFCEGSGPLVHVSPHLLDEPLLENIGTREPVCQTVFTQTSEANPLPFSYGVEDSQIAGNVVSPDNNSEGLAKYSSGDCDDLNGCNGIAFVNIDSYEPDSSDGEEDGQDRLCLLREEAGVFQETLDNIVSEFEKDVVSFTHLQSQLSTLSDRVSREYCEEIEPVPLTRYFSTDSDFTHPNNRTYKKSAEVQAILKSNLRGGSHETQQVNTVNVENRTCVTTCNEVNIDGESEQRNSPELIVRPKIRKPNPTSRLNREKLPSHEEESMSRREGDIEDIQQGCADFPFRNDKEKLGSSMLLDSRWYSGPQSNTKADLRRSTSAQEQKFLLDDSSFWDEFEDCSRHLPVSHRDDDRVQMFLEEGEIPWLQYHEEIESSSDEENYPSGDFVHPGFFMLDGNNLEDDSSMSEDLDVEWRLLDEFDGLGAQVVSYVDPQFFTYMALEERLAQAMENALAHLESLAVDVEQAHPPATKESIDCLPQITVTDDYAGTCPVCRHVLAPVLPEAAGATASFLPDDDSSSSV
ncbi:UNVERIFIED_CONTAM: hypothetical protein H355_013897, partial [Colinus virginianus]